MNKNYIFFQNIIFSIQKEFWKIFNFNCIYKQIQFLPKNGYGPASPLRVTKHAWKKSGNFYWLLATRCFKNFEKYSTLIFVKIWVWPAKPFRVTKNAWKFLKFLLLVKSNSNFETNTQLNIFWVISKRNFEKNTQLKFLPKNGRGPATPLWVT